MSKTPSPERTILIMDDEPQVRRLMKRTLEGVGYLVLEADSSAPAASVSSQHHGRIGLLIAHIIMPLPDGYPATARLSRARCDSGGLK